jgi:hypothetical protein
MKDEEPVPLCGKSQRDHKNKNTVLYSTVFLFYSTGRQVLLFRKSNALLLAFEDPDNPAP